MLSIPSISAQSKHKKDINRAAKWLQKKLGKLGFNSKILPTSGHPVVFGEWLKAGNKKPSILIYGHYDVQDTGDLTQWASPPFKPDIRGGNIYARGASDDKGNFYTWISALSEINKRRSKPPINIKFLIEGEEEVASKNLRRFVSQNKRLLKADIAVISDTTCFNEETPVIHYGLRGIVYYELIVKTLMRDVHSGSYGGNVLNPVNVLSTMVSKLKDDRHKILIPGIYRNVRKLRFSEKRKLIKLPVNSKTIISQTGASLVIGEKGFSEIERKGARPSLDVNGIWGGYSGEGPKTIIPSEAGAKISIRIVPNQKADEVSGLFEKYINKITPKGAEIKLKYLGGDNPILMNTKTKYFKIAEKALKKTFSKKPSYNIEGGSIPVTAIFKDILGIDSVLMGYALPDDGHHSPNEKMSLAMFEKGIRTNIEFLKSL